MHHASRQIICRSIHEKHLSRRVDLWAFVPHYPYPPPGRRWACGMQKPSSSSLITHTTHAVAIAEGSSEPLALSNPIHEPIWRVMLWYSNPYHFFTGFVEASVSAGHGERPQAEHSW